MAALQNFRSAFNGFNREDVVHYIEYINNQHNAQVNQLKTQLQTLQAELEQYRTAPVQDPLLPEKLEAAESKCAQLEAELSDVRDQLEQAIAENESKKNREAELEAYRRAERAERIAQERVSQLYAQANSALADATVKVDEASAQIGALADSITGNLSALHSAVTGSKSILQHAAAELYAIRPVSENE